MSALAPPPGTSLKGQGQLAKNVPSRDLGRLQKPHFRF
jgi:hypothetical protein